MSENAMLAIVLSVSIASCTTCSLSDKLSGNQDPVIECIRLANGNAGRLDCMKPQESQK